MGRLLGVPHLSPRSRDSSRLSESDAHAHAQSWLCLGASDIDRLRLQRTRTRTRSYFHCEPGGCCLHREHTLFPAWADTHSYTHTHTRTASFRALSYTGFVTTGPTLTFTYTYALFSEKTVWNSHCDGAYPQPQWDCACSAYNISLLPCGTYSHKLSGESSISISISCCSVLLSPRWWLKSSRLKNSFPVFLYTESCHAHRVCNCTLRPFRTCNKCSSIQTRSGNHPF